MVLICRRDRVDRSDEKAIVVGRTLLKDYQLVFNKKSTFQEINGERVCLLNGKANIGRASEINASVFGVLFSLTQSQIDWLDHAEGARMRPPHYQKKIVSVTLQNEPNANVVVNAFTYVATDQFTSEGYIKPTEEYLSRIFEGARENGIDTHPIELAANNYSK